MVFSMLQTYKYMKLDLKHGKNKSCTVTSILFMYPWIEWVEGGLC